MNIKPACPYLPGLARVRAYCMTENSTNIPPHATKMCVSKVRNKCCTGLQRLLWGWAENFPVRPHVDG